MRDHSETLEAISDTIEAGSVDGLTPEQTIGSIIAALSSGGCLAPAPSPDAPAGWREVEMMRLIDLLRSEEGDSVTILCDNPDGPPNNAVVCNGYWTNWEDRRFSQDTLLDALSAAMIEYKRPLGEKVAAATRTAATSGEPVLKPIEKWANEAYRKAVYDANRMNDKGEVPAAPTPSPQPLEDNRWISEAQSTLDHLSRFLQKTGAPHRVDWKEWIDSADKHLGLKWPNETTPSPDASAVMRADAAFMDVMLDETQPGTRLEIRRRALAAALASSAPVEEGYVVVPSDPTEAMLKAARKAWFVENVGPYYSGYGDIYRAMLDAAPVARHERVTSQPDTDPHGDGKCGCTERCKDRDNCQYDVDPATPSLTGDCNA